jgi:hypothetical protein
VPLQLGEEIGGVHWAFCPHLIEEWIEKVNERRARSNRLRQMGAEACASRTNISAAEKRRALVHD